MMIAKEDKDKMKEEEIARFNRLFRAYCKGPVAFANDEIDAQRQVKNGVHHNEINPIDVAKIRTYMYGQLENASFDDRSAYIRARNVFLSFLTLVNTRRGGEVGRLIWKKRRED